MFAQRITLRGRAYNTLQVIISKQKIYGKEENSKEGKEGKEVVKEAPIVRFSPRGVSESASVSEALFSMCAGARKCLS